MQVPCKLRHPKFVSPLRKELMKMKDIYLVFLFSFSRVESSGYPKKLALVGGPKKWFEKMNVRVTRGLD